MNKVIWKKRSNNKHFFVDWNEFFFLLFDFNSKWKRHKLKIDFPLSFKWLLYKRTHTHTNNTGINKQNGKWYFNATIISKKESIDRVINEMTWINIGTFNTDNSWVVVLVTIYSGCILVNGLRQAPMMQRTKNKPDWTQSNTLLSLFSCYSLILNQHLLIPDMQKSKLKLSRKLSSCTFCRSLSPLLKKLLLVNWQVNDKSQQEMRNTLTHIHISDVILKRLFD